jgi:hypothetical protein
MINPLSENELDISFSGAFIEEWIKGSPAQVMEHLKTVVDGVALYRNKYLAAQEDHAILQARYNDLTALSSQYLMIIQELRQQVDGLLIETQRDLHHHESE